MNNNVEISCSFNTTNPSAPLGLEVRLDGELVFDVNHVDKLINFKHSIDDTDADHCLEFIMKNKSPADTTIDENGTIIQDSRLIISDLEFDGIGLNQIFSEQATYLHDFNGTGEPVKEKFYGEMGCNGTVRLMFRSPVYIWLLEVM